MCSRYDLSDKGVSYLLKQYSTREAAKMIGISFASINRYIAERKIPVPAVQEFGGGQFRVWTEEDIERVREILPKIANGRKTRHQKQKAQPKKKKTKKSKP
jgi:DNA-binding transcriptional MerR regulator